MACHYGSLSGKAMWLLRQAYSRDFEARFIVARRLWLFAVPLWIIANAAVIVRHFAWRGENSVLNKRMQSFRPRFEITSNELREFATLSTCRIISGYALLWENYFRRENIKLWFRIRKVLRQSIFNFIKCVFRKLDP